MIRLVVFDWAGTLIDFGSLAPLEAYRQVFAAQGVTVASEEIRPFMGLHKRDHLSAILKLPAVAERWRAARGEEPSDRDIDRMYQQFMPIQMDELRRHSRLVPGAAECVAALRARGVLLGGSTGYFREAAELVAAAAREQGVVLDCNICADDVAVGRPAPWMIYRNMERLGVYPPSAVVKIGDTVADVQEGRNAGAWSLGVTSSGSEIGVAVDEWTSFSESERRSRLDRARDRLRSGGAHAVIDDIASLPERIEQFEHSGQWR